MLNLLPLTRLFFLLLEFLGYFFSRLIFVIVDVLI